MSLFFLNFASIQYFKWNNPDVSEGQTQIYRLGIATILFLHFYELKSIWKNWQMKNMQVCGVFLLAENFLQDSKFFWTQSSGEKHDGEGVRFKHMFSS